tara:strand:- start:62 stop:274 length:213 start_codon:yes stop_codon:yes gene_type:complete
MQKVYKKLTEGQKEKGIIFTSTLSTNRTELIDDTTHEVYSNDEDKRTTIDRLLDDKFFNGSHYNFNIIRK